MIYFPICSTFDNNTSLESTEDTSAIAAFRFPTMFSGVTRFVRNRGGGVTLLNTQMIVQENASLYFDSNTAVFGAGIAMDDRCLVSVWAYLCVCECECVHVCVHTCSKEESFESLIIAD